MNIKVVALAFLLIAWGADYFWRSAAEQNLKKIEFITLGHQLTNNNSELQFIKYIVQDRMDSKLLALDYRGRLEAIQATFALLKETSIKPDKNIQQEAQSLWQFVNNAYKKGDSLEPGKIKRNIRHEIVELERKLQRFTLESLISARKRLKIWHKVFVAMYIIGSILLIASECNRSIKT